MCEFELPTSCNISATATSTWKIKNFSQLKGGEYLITPAFECHDETWNLYLYPQSNYWKSDKIEIFFKVGRTEPLGDDFAVEVSLKTKNEVMYLAENGSFLFKGNPPSWGYSCFVDRQTLLVEKNDYFLPNDTLTVICDITKYDQKITHGITMKIGEQKIADKNSSSSSHQKALCRDLKHLSSNQRWCDVTLRAGDKDFPAVKAVLAARSSVFESMFRHKEPVSSVIDASEIEAATMEQMLHYVYTGEVWDLSKETAMNLFTAADKYALLELKEDCIQFLVSILSAENFWELALLAEQHQDTALKKSVKCYVRKNPASFFVTHQWMSLLKERPHFVTEILEAVAANFFPNDYITESYQTGDSHS